ncbi:N-acetylglucosaminyl phosphatidylinositol de-N-acetylase [Handroanthus impetiginosus]|uniref:N-acetylglucosaminylphosphatidylinositol deacetylase n=1 Tax=Handroanthus impetiginosus TaxID=429701 RepID=A0A2G9HRW9_9LAMI|nr:N-acetylglucosaminyl phosphatidylinositol de-N-acetylase [Handroanthus impetiginosus]
MAWVSILLSVVVLWVASLCKILHRSFSASEATFLRDGAVSRRRNVLLVIAHPDDESMFFTPTINYLISRGHNLFVLCMSNGNADGMGNIRKEELYLASTILKIPTGQVKILDHPDLQDGFGNAWNWNLLASIIEEETCAHAIDLIITFDGYGVSGHCNHCDVHHGVRKLLHGTSGRHIEAWELASINILRKYSGPLDIWLSIIFARFQPNGQSHCLLNLDPRKSYAAMAQHSSQWVWYRKLFVTFSSYTYVNTLRKIQ